MYLKMGRHLAAAILATAVGVGSADAQTVQYTSKGTGAGVGLTVQKALTDTPATTVNAFVGEIFLYGISVSPVGSVPGIDAGTTSLRAWCIDIFGVLQNGWTYTAGSINSADATKINALITGGDGVDNIFQSSEAAATQLAIWKVIYGRNNISSNDGTLNNLANNYFDYASAGTNGFSADASKYVLGLLENPNTNAQQQLVTLLNSPPPPGGGNQSVPEPASLALVAVGMLGLGLARRRTSNK